MFERYTEKARRVIFFARYEASQFGSPYIETEHLLLGILREDKNLTSLFLRSHATAESIRQQIEKASLIREKIATSVDLPLSNESKRTLAFAAEEAERRNDKHIGTEHLFLGLMREKDCIAASILNERGIQLDSAREKIAGDAPTMLNRSQAGPGLTRDLTQAAQEGSLPAIIGRDEEVAAVIEVLSSYARFPLLIGPHGAGKTAIVHGLAQRIANEAVPTRLVHAHIVEAEPAQFVRQFGPPADSAHIILFIDLVQQLSTSGTRPNSHPLSTFLKWIHAHPNFQCIAIADEPEITEALKTDAWLPEIFREIYVRPLDERATHAVLMSRKPVLEEHHGIIYCEAAIEAALTSAAANPSRGSLVQVALDLLDAAGALVSIGAVVLPEIAEARTRLRSIRSRSARAVMNHELEKARLYSDEERKERENLRLLEERLGVAASSTTQVTPDHIQQVVARWSAYPYSPG